MPEGALVRMRPWPFLRVVEGLNVPVVISVSTASMGMRPAKAVR